MCRRNSFRLPVQPPSSSTIVVDVDWTSTPRPGLRRLSSSSFFFSDLSAFELHLQSLPHILPFVPRLSLLLPPFRQIPNSFVSVTAGCWLPFTFLSVSLFTDSQCRKRIPPSPLCPSLLRPHALCVCPPEKARHWTQLHVHARRRCVCMLTAEPASRSPAGCGSCSC